MNFFLECDKKKSGFLRQTHLGRRNFQILPLTYAKSLILFHFMRVMLGICTRIKYTAL